MTNGFIFSFLKSPLLLTLGTHPAPLQLGQLLTWRSSMSLSLSPSFAVLICFQFGNWRAFLTFESPVPPETYILPLLPTCYRDLAKGFSVKRKTCFKDGYSEDHAVKATEIKFTDPCSHSRAPHCLPRELILHIDYSYDSGIRRQGYNTPQLTIWAPSVRSISLSVSAIRTNYVKAMYFREHHTFWKFP